MTTPKFQLQEILEGGESNEVPINEGMRILEAFISPFFTSFSLNTPPLSPVAGTVHITGEAPTGAWAGHADSVAVYRSDSTWQFWELSSIPCLFGYDGTSPLMWTGGEWLIISASTM